MCQSMEYASPSGIPLLPQIPPLAVFVVVRVWSSYTWFAQKQFGNLYHAMINFKYCSYQSWPVTLHACSFTGRWWLDRTVNVVKVNKKSNWAFRVCVCVLNVCETCVCVCTIISIVYNEHEDIRTKRANLFIYMRIAHHRANERSGAINTFAQIHCDRLHNRNFVMTRTRTSITLTPINQFHFTSCLSFFLSRSSKQI